ncbi:MAG TPA: rhodanese-like domain-containing protein [Rhodanobacter sp.]|nr:rhodanese-like domain-containing protein [Rhodanobacter sp.]
MIEALNTLLSTYGLWLVFLVVLLDQGGIPIPAWPPLVVASAQAMERQEPVWPILLAATLAALVADTLWYLAGRRHGAHMLRLICRVSLSPDSCVSSTREIYAKWGPPSLVLAKFIPGFAAIGTTLAGHQRTPLRRFVAYDGTGAVLWAGVAIATGTVFHGAVNDALMTLESMGRVGLGVVLVAIAAFIIRKYWKRRLFLRELRMERISVLELQALMDKPESPLLIDVRSEAERDATGWIPGAVHAARVADLVVSATGEVVVYCDCPNEASAALVASQLKQLGFVRVRPLAGGLEAWRSHGLPVETTSA